jgi:hypothetical protein
MNEVPAIVRTPTRKSQESMPQQILWRPRQSNPFQMGVATLERRSMPGIGGVGPVGCGNPSRH